MANGAVAIDAPSGYIAARKTEDLSFPYHTILMSSVQFDDNV